MSVGLRGQPPWEGPVADPSVPPSQAASHRWLLAVLAGLVLLAAICPPFFTLTERYVCAETLQYLSFAVIVPALLVLGAPWHRPGRAGALCRRIDARRRHAHSPVAGLPALVGALAVLVIWRLPPLVDRVVTLSWPLALEAITLIVAGTAVWVELVPSRPFAPRLQPPSRLALAAVTMWVLWITGYAVGLANSDTYPVFAQLPARAISVPADQQLAAAAMWFVPAVAFIPVAFRNLMRFLRGGEAAEP
jgi:cytochrome c oxidase assembly factor CtaG